ncbi:unnamed protein product [Fraxinus pennsylvanica]|uniref:Uncharacterized protein n=1 Tax=Fraxinus pennsylvanica TaxID=56036 RepID=A0AAD1YNG1_9LAMI|nr:unnamed protein product [Fraxinus pennsylvanica]
METLQVKVAALGVNGFELSKMRNLKELELSIVPPRPLAFPILSEIAGFKCLTRLSVCHFSIRFTSPLLEINAFGSYGLLMINLHLLLFSSPNGSYTTGLKRITHQEVMELEFSLPNRPIL